MKVTNRIEIELENGKKIKLSDEEGKNLFFQLEKIYGKEKEYVYPLVYPHYYYWIKDNTTPYITYTDNDYVTSGYVNTEPFSIEPIENEYSFRVNC